MQKEFVLIIDEETQGSRQTFQSVDCLEREVSKIIDVSTYEVVIKKRAQQASNAVAGRGMDKIRISGTRLYINGHLLKSVKQYELKSFANEYTELSVKMLVNVEDIELLSRVYRKVDELKNIKTKETNSL